jgi:hypothetical protein
MCSKMFLLLRRSSEAAQPAAEGVSKQQQVQPTPTPTHILDPAIKQALIDSNRDTGNS